MCSLSEVAVDTMTSDLMNLSDTSHVGTCVSPIREHSDLHRYQNVYSHCHEASIRLLLHQLHPPQLQQVVPGIL